jgi:hypothetical protein
MDVGNAMRKEETMKSLWKKIEDLMVAVTFAEEAEFETAVKVVNGGTESPCLCEETDITTAATEVI